MTVETLYECYQSSWAAMLMAIQLPQRSCSKTTQKATLQHLHVYFMRYMKTRDLVKNEKYLKNVHQRLFGF